MLSGLGLVTTSEPCFDSLLSGKGSDGGFK
jgi:hypothetical protein